jgi:hypothetical protein
MTTTALILSPALGLVLARLCAPTPKAAQRVVEFFTAQINNEHTPKAYLNAARRFAGWCEAHALLENAQILANHASSRTTKLYDRRSDEISLDEVEKISI